MAVQELGVLLIRRLQDVACEFVPSVAGQGVCQVCEIDLLVFVFVCGGC